MNSLLKDNSTTKYARIIDDLMKRIDRGEFLPTGRIPSENELSRDYRVSVMTVRKALSELVYREKILRIQGKGSFVNASGRPGGSDSSANAARPGAPITPHKGFIPLIMFCCDDWENSFMYIIKGAQTCLSRRGYSMSIECNHEDAQTEAEILDRCIRNKAAGVLIYSIDPAANAGKIMALEEAGIPVVMVDRGLDTFPCTLVTSYNFGGLYQITGYLIGLGHRSIAYFANETPTSVHTERLRGFKAAFAREGLEAPEELCITGSDLQVETLGKIIPKYGVTAVACLNDRIAVQVSDYLQAQGYRVPGDISVTGFDDNELSRYTSLTTVRQNFRRIGEVGAERLLDRVTHGAGHSQTMLPVELIIRDSAGPVTERGGSRDAVK
jgi:DNA-binding LacI/PurR family transcriptional regulator/DNA-binding transcriptional regulator YhcF (GntR family)